ncbi:MAG: hypothetical protein ACLT2T_16605 [Bilophila wadsworthia]
MLPRIREAVTRASSASTVEHITEALELLTGIPAGKPQERRVHP